LSGFVQQQMQLRDHFNDRKVAETTQDAATNYVDTPAPKTAITITAKQRAYTALVDFTTPGY
jgi:hypothetical protein